MQLSALAYTPNYRAYTLCGHRSADTIEILETVRKAYLTFKRD